MPWGESGGPTAPRSRGQAGLRGRPQHHPAWNQGKTARREVMMSQEGWDTGEGQGWARKRTEEGSPGERVRTGSSSPGLGLRRTKGRVAGGRRGRGGL